MRGRVYIMLIVITFVFGETTAQEMISDSVKIGNAESDVRLHESMDVSPMQYDYKKGMIEDFRMENGIDSNISGNTNIPSFTTDDLPVLNNRTRQFNMSTRLPYASDCDNSGAIMFSDGTYFHGNSSFSSMPLLMSKQSLSLGLDHTSGNFTYGFTATANRYFFNSMINQYGIGGYLSYNIDNNMSATIFGNYYNQNPFFTMGTFPYVNTSAFGGYMTYRSGRFAVDVGVKHEYDPVVQKWRTVPIVTPSFRIGKVTVELPVGDLLRKVAEKIIR